MQNQLEMEAIRHILLRDWDPFCVGDNPNLADEYDGFIGDIFRLLKSKCSSEELSAHLLSVEKKIGAPISDIHRRKVVLALRGLI